MKSRWLNGICILRCLVVDFPARKYISINPFFSIVKLFQCDEKEQFSFLFSHSLRFFFLFFHWIDTFIFHPIPRSITIALVVLPGLKNRRKNKFPLYPSVFFCSFPLFLLYLSDKCVCIAQRDPLFLFFFFFFSTFFISLQRLLYLTIRIDYQDVLKNLFFFLRVRTSVDVSFLLSLLLDTFDDELIEVSENEN